MDKLQKRGGSSQIDVICVVVPKSRCITCFSTVMLLALYDASLACYMLLLSLRLLRRLYSVGGVPLWAEKEKSFVVLSLSVHLLDGLEEEKSYSVPRREFNCIEF